jgi:hypothetical protein
MVKHEDGNQRTGAIVRGGKVDLGVLNDAEEVPSSQAELDKQMEKELRARVLWEKNQQIANVKGDVVMTNVTI